MFDLFISYAHENQDYVRLLHDSLEKAGLQIFRDEKDPQLGENLETALKTKIIASRALLLIWSKAAAASTNVKLEYTYASDCGIKIIPLLLDDIELPEKLKGIWYGSIKSFQPLELVDTIRKRCMNSTSTVFKKKSSTFVGRDELTRTIFDKISHRCPCVIWGPRGCGVSTLLERIQDPLTKEKYLSKDGKHCTMIYVQLRNEMSASDNGFDAEIFWSRVHHMLEDRDETYKPKASEVSFSKDGWLEQHLKEYEPGHVLVLIIDDLHLLFDEPQYFEDWSKPRRGLAPEIHFRLYDLLERYKDRFTLVGGSERNHDRLATPYPESHMKNLLTKLSTSFVKCNLLTKDDIKRALRERLGKNARKDCIERVTKATGGVPSLLEKAIIFLEENSDSDLGQLLNELYVRSQTELVRLWTSYSYWEQQFFKMVALKMFPTILTDVPSSIQIVSELFMQHITVNSQRTEAQTHGNNYSN